MWNNAIEEIAETPPAPLPPAVDSIIGFGIPIIFLVGICFAFSYYIYLIHRGRLELNETLIWIFFTIFMIFIALYLLVLQIMYSLGHSGYNLFAELATVLGFGKYTSWLIFVILILLTFLYAKSFHTTIKIAKLKKQINILAKEIAIINGKMSSNALKKDDTRNGDKGNEDQNDNTSNKG